MKIKITFANRNRPFQFMGKEYTFDEFEKSLERVKRYDDDISLVKDNCGNIYISTFYECMGFPDDFISCHWIWVKDEEDAEKGQINALTDRRVPYISHDQTENFRIYEYVDEC